MSCCDACVAGPPRPRVELPRRDDDLLLRFGERLEAAVALHAGALAHRLALRGDELLFERLHLEEEDVAARFRRAAAARRRRAHARNR